MVIIRTITCIVKTLKQRIQEDALCSLPPSVSIVVHCCLSDGALIHAVSERRDGGELGQM